MIYDEDWKIANKIIIMWPEITNPIGHFAIKEAANYIVNRHQSEYL